MRFSFTVISRIILEHEPGTQRSTLEESNLRLEISKNLDRKMYLDNKDLPKEPATKPVTQALIQGLMTNIKLAHEKGWMNEADHLRYVIDELQRAFTHVAYSEPKINEGTMDDNM